MFYPHFTRAVLLASLALARLVHCVIDPTAYLSSQVRVPAALACRISSLPLLRPSMCGAPPMHPQDTAPDYTINGVWKAHQHLPNYAHVQQAAGDTFTFLPQQYLEEYKNPCWRLVRVRQHTLLAVACCITADGGQTRLHLLIFSALSPCC